MSLQPIGKIKSGKQNTVNRYTSNSATPIGANTMFLQISKRYTLFSALHQFFPILLIIWVPSGGKLFYVKYKMVSL